MGPFFGMVVSVLVVGAMIVGVNKGYGYYEAVNKITFKFTSLSDLKMRNLDLSFKVTITAVNPTAQPINLDAIFIDLVIVKAGKSITIAQIRNEEFNTTIKAKANSKVVLPIKTSLVNAGPILVNDILSFFTKQDNKPRSIYAIGNITAEGFRISIDEQLSQTS